MQVRSFRLLAFALPSLGALAAGGARLVSGWLRNVIGLIEEEDGDLFIGSLADVNRTMNPIGRLIPIDLPSLGRQVQTWAPVPVFDHDRVAAEYHGDSVKRVAVPGSRFTGFEALPPDQDGTAMMQDLIDHMLCSPHRLTSCT